MTHLLYVSLPSLPCSPSDLDASETPMVGSLLHLVPLHSLMLLDGLLAAHLRALLTFYCLARALLTSYALVIINLSHWHALVCHLAVFSSTYQYLPHSVFLRVLSSPPTRMLNLQRQGI